MAIWGTHFLPAGVASVFGSAAPVFLALFAWVFLRELPGRRQVAGIALGLAGLAAMAWLSSSGAGFRPNETDRISLRPFIRATGSGA